MQRRALASLCLSVALTACAYQYQPPGAAPAAAPVPVAPAGRPVPHVAILAPLSGPLGDRGLALVNGAQLALSVPGAPVLDVRDTFGTPAGAAGAAREAVAAGDAVIIGPLTAAETASVAPIAQAAGVPVLAFTNDVAMARPGVWTMGITPGQQVRRLMGLLRERGKMKVAGLLPHNDFGQAMEAALTRSATEFGMPPPSLREYAATDPGSIAAGLAGLASHTAPTIPGAAATVYQPPAVTPAAPPAGQPSASFPFDALLLADTGGGLSTVAQALPNAGVQQPGVQILGPALWASPSAGASVVPGAWYAAADPGPRAGYEISYRQKYGVPAPAISDLAFDAASIARVVAASGPASLTAQSFAGADGPARLLPDGHVLRGLAVFAVQPGGPAQLIAPPPVLSGPGA